jgi:hypothetical protein
VCAEPGRAGGDYLHGWDEPFDKVRDKACDKEQMTRKKSPGE